ncbi:flagellar FliL protein [Hasllibacter halocynthiae]|uniref:Flagellar protein FliL n=1 Tax=Hasllibacter halocynthiae TaxID=595589 RepID=A0A2T0X2L8_9RHOB|nr:flagellar basal body-associated FliL family protein [Hasllibacter halocynthiae]PRY93199.1 flagellar FliL protein [Hasllibacter halocynthiae]
MTTETPDPEAPAPPESGGRGKRGPLIALVLAALAGAGAYAAVALGGVPSFGGGGADGHGGAPAEPAAEVAAAASEKPVFVSVPALTVTLLLPDGRANLRLSAELEVAPDAADAVAQAMPRILDAMNAYLRAVEPDSLLERSAHVRLRGQLLRRVRIVTGREAVRDLLLTELVTL